MLTFLTGFIASIAHVVTGPDHLAAVTPLAIDSRKKSWMVGFSWGLGHTIGMLLIGLSFVLFKGLLPVEAISKYSETAIGTLLIGIGCLALFRIYRHHSHGNKPHAHFHTTPYLYTHIHQHSHGAKPISVLGRVNQKLSPKPSFTLVHEQSHTQGSDHGHGHEHKLTGKFKQNAISAFSIGIIHGFAGFSHLFALLPSLALPSVWESVIYITAFAMGTVLTMIIFAFILGLVAFKSVIKDKQIFLKWFTFSGALLAIAIGLLWIIHPF